MFLQWWRLLAMFFCFIFAQPALAHLNWVVDEKEAKYFMSGVYFWEPINYWTLGLAIVLTVMILKMHVFMRNHELFKIVIKTKYTLKSFMSMVSILAGVMLIINSMDSIFVAPEIQLNSDLPFKSVILIQALIGMFLISNISLFCSGICLLAGALILLLMIPFDNSIHYFFEFAFLGGAFIAVGYSPEKSLNKIGLLFLRLGIGCSLIVLGIHEKLMQPGLGIAFLKHYDFNFIHHLGFQSFSNLDFVLFIGIAEVVLGVLLCIGAFVRPLSLIIFLTMSLTAALLGITELIGHLPLMGLLVVLFVYGSGSLKGEEIWIINLTQWKKFMELKSLI